MRNLLRPFPSVLLFVAATLLPAAILAETVREPFIRAEATAHNPFAGEEILLTYTLFFTGEGPQVSDASNPSLKGLWSEELDPGRFVRSRKVTVSGAVWRSAIIRQFKLSAIRPGRYVIDGYRLNCLMPATPSVQGGRTLTLSAPAVVLQARKLPEPVPDGFSGAVGTFSFTLSAEPAIIREGEPVTLTASVNGTGNLPSLMAPLPEISPSVSRSVTSTDLSLDTQRALSSGTHKTTLTLYPEEAGTLDIASARFIYFDPAACRYRTAASGPIKVRVLPVRRKEYSVSETEQQSGITKSPAEEGTRILPFAVSLAALMLALGALYTAGRKRSENRRSKTVSGRGNPATGSESPDLLRSRIYAAVSERGVARPESLTKTQLADALYRTGISANTAERVKRLLDLIDRSLYSPLRLSEDELVGLQRETAAVTNELRQPKSPAGEEGYR